MIRIDLTGRKILITGGFGAIANYIVRRLEEAGATMVLTDLASPDETTVANYYRMDVTRPEEVADAVGRVFNDHPDLDIALGHAGGTGIFPFVDTPPSKFEELVRFNFLGQAFFAHAVVRQWIARRMRGHLIFTSSYVSRIPMAGISAYASAKAALEMFTRSLALEVAEHGIRVNAIAPGNVAAGSSLKVYETDPVYRAWVDRVSPLGKRNSPEAIANAFLYLCSSLGDELDGHVLQVDMGVGLPKLG